MNHDADMASLPTSPPSIPLKRKHSDKRDPLDHGSDTIQCICGFSYDDGFSIACDQCLRWCHAACFDIAAGQVPDEWQCWICRPRLVDRDKATKLQRARVSLVNGREEGSSTHRRHGRGATADGGRGRRRRYSTSTAHANEDEHVDIDEPWMHTYDHIDKDIIPHSATRDRLLRQAQHWRGVTALSNNDPTEHATHPVFLSHSRESSRPPTTVRELPSSTAFHSTVAPCINPAVRSPSYAMHTTSPISSSHLITQYKSTIIPSAAYLSDPLNRYAHLSLPKPFVHLFGPPLDVALDSRVTGNEARFARNGCKPNAILQPIVCGRHKDDSNNDNRCNGDALSFGIFALRDLKAEEEVVLGWEWDDGSVVHKLPAMIRCPESFTSDHVDYIRYQMIDMLHTITSTFPHCACGAKARNCAFNRMAEFIDGTAPVPRDPFRRSQESVDEALSPLIGSERGFRTRERVPGTGGMYGVEMIPQSTSIKSMATAKSSRPDGAWSMGAQTEAHHPRSVTPPDTKGKGRVYDDDFPPNWDPIEAFAAKGWDKFVARITSKNEAKPSTDEAIHPKSPPSLPKAHLPGPGPGEKQSIQSQEADQGLPGPGEDRDENEDEDEELPEEREETMPPKLRKRWIHEALVHHRAIYGHPRPTSDEPMCETPAEEKQQVAMDVDDDAHSHTTDTRPLPTSLPSIQVDNTSLDTQHSPSSAFANLSLVSPALPMSANPITRTPVAESSQLRNTSVDFNDDFESKFSPEMKQIFTWAERVSGVKPRPWTVPWDPLGSMTRINPGERLPVSYPYSPAHTPELDSWNQSSSLPKNDGPSQPPPPPAPPRVKLTLQDFALRRKKQREEEEAAKKAALAETPVAESGPSTSLPKGPSTPPRPSSGEPGEIEESPIRHPNVDTKGKQPANSGIAPQFDSLWRRRPSGVSAVNKIPVPELRGFTESLRRQQPAIRESRMDVAKPRRNPVKYGHGTQSPPTHPRSLRPRNHFGARHFPEARPVPSGPRALRTAGSLPLTPGSNGNSYPPPRPGRSANDRKSLGPWK